MDIIIIGGGISGLMSARELSAAGARVTLLEKHALGQESSWAGGGILSPLYPWRSADPINALSHWSQGVYPSLADELKVDTGIDPEWIRSGLLIADCSDGAAFRAWAERYQARFQMPDGDELGAIAPGVTVEPNHPVWLPDIAQVRNPRLLAALRKDLSARGVVIRENTEISSLDIAAGGLRGVITGAGRLQADRYVVTAGAWSALLTTDAAPKLKVFPVKGQMLVFQAVPGLLSAIVLSQGHYLIPRRDGRILAGSTIEHTEFDKSTTAEARTELFEFAVDTLPQLKNFPVEKHWAGLRPGTPEGIPYIGRHPDIDNLYFNCGHFRNGFAMAPASARLLTDLMLERPPILPPEPFRLAAPH